MKYIIGLLFILLTTPSHASSGTKISNIKCKGGWIRAGTSKLEVISYCGQPKYEDVISGADMIKSEKLLYTIKRKDYIIWLHAGEIKEMEMLLKRNQ
jgi:hypothetical protein